MLLCFMYYKDKVHKDYIFCIYILYAITNSYMGIDGQHLFLSCCCASVSLSVVVLLIYFRLQTSFSSFIRFISVLSCISYL
jgi:hypothetical protein